MSGSRVVALAYDGLCTFEYGCTVELFALDRPELGVDWYRFSTCAVEPGPLRAAGGITVVAPYALRTLDRADTIVVPGWRDPDERPPEALLRRLRAAWRRGTRLCSICSGVFVLAAAGVLDGRTVTTHWRYADRLAQRYPTLRVDPNALYIPDGPIVTSAGSAAGLDMLLYLVRQDYGARIANRVAQRLVVAPHRVGGQSQFVPRPMPADDGGRLTRLMDWVRAHPAQPHSIASLARRAGMSPRTMQRHFQASLGLGPVQWVTQERVAFAKELLEGRDLPMARVAERAGFGSEETLRHHFRRITGTSPTAYRRSFTTRNA